jgi:hypothetical protein
MRLLIRAGGAAGRMLGLLEQRVGPVVVSGGGRRLRHGRERLNSLLAAGGTANRQLCLLDQPCGSLLVSGCGNRLDKRSQFLRS